MPGFRKSQTRIKGRIGHFGLTDWWLTHFTDEERAQIQRTFQPLGSLGDSLTSGEISYTSETPVGFLQALSGWFTKDEERSIAHRILDKALELSSGRVPVLDIHFLYQQMINIYYKDRNQPEYMVKAVDACKRQIALATEAAMEWIAEYGNPLPAHKGYEQLAIILEKEGSFPEAIELCIQAQSQGWAGDWEKRMARLRKKAQKA